MERVGNGFETGVFVFAVVPVRRRFRCASLLKAEGMPRELPPI